MVSLWQCMLRIICLLFHYITVTSSGTFSNDMLAEWFERNNASLVSLQNSKEPVAMISYDECDLPVYANPTYSQFSAHIQGKEAALFVGISDWPMLDLWQKRRRRDGGAIDRLEMMRDFLDRSTYSSEEDTCDDSDTNFSLSEGFRGDCWNWNFSGRRFR